MTENEKEKMRILTQESHAMAEMISEDIPDDMKAMMLGSGLATFDAMFAIRDGESWRGVTGAEEIARKFLRETGLGD